MLNVDVERNKRLDRFDLDTAIPRRFFVSASSDGSGIESDEFRSFFFPLFL